MNPTDRDHPDQTRGACARGLLFALAAVALLGLLVAAVFVLVAVLS